MASIYLKTCSADSLQGELLNIHLVSRDNQVIPGQITYEDEMIVVNSATENNVAICLLYDIGKAGRLMLQTGILTPREHPYMLAQELARHRIKLFLDMCENWSLFHLEDHHHAVQKWEESRVTFTNSLVAEGDTESAILARQSLELGISATDSLALTHAQILLYKRYGKKPASSPILGVNVNPVQFGESLQEIIAKHIDIVQIPIEWSQVENSPGKYNWDLVDRWVLWARNSKKHIIAGPLIDFAKPGALPSWVREEEHDFAKLRDACYSYVEQAVNRYGGAISFWSVISGININSQIALTLNHMIDLIRTVNLVVRQKLKKAKVMIEIAHPFSEFVTSKRDSCNASVLVARLSQEGVRLDALGVQLLIGSSGGRSVRDLMILSAKLDEFIYAELPVIVSALGAPSETVSQTHGWWKSGWSEHVQEKWAEHLFAIALSKPFVNSVIWSDLYDYPRMNLPTSAFVSAHGKPRAVLGKLVKMRRRLNKPLGELETLEESST